MRAPAVVLLLALLPACAIEPAPPPDLSATVRQYRSDVALRMLSVTTTNRTGVAVTLRRVQLLARGFVALPAAPVDVVLQPGDRVDVPAGYGAPRCDAALPAGVDAVRMRVQAAGADPVEVLVPLSPAGGLLARLRTSECAQAALQEAVTVELGPSWLRGDDRLEGALVVRRRTGDLPVEVLEPGGHIVFTVRGALPALLAPGQQELSVPIAVTPTRCDGHALSQNSRSAVFPFVVALGDADPVPMPAVAGPDLQAQLQALATDVCVPPG